MRIVGHSMAPTLLPGALVWVDEAAYVAQPPRRGDVVAARPQGCRGRALVKRIAGGPNEQVTMGSARVILGPDEYFLSGDAPHDSLDSRTLGPVKQQELIGRVWVPMAVRRRR